MQYTFHQCLLFGLRSLPPNPGCLQSVTQSSAVQEVTSGHRPAQAWEIYWTASLREKDSWKKFHFYLWCWLVLLKADFRKQKNFFFIYISSDRIDLKIATSFYKIFFYNCRINFLESDLQASSWRMLNIWFCLHFCFSY